MYTVCRESVTNECNDNKVMSGHKSFVFEFVFYSFIHASLFLWWIFSKQCGLYSVRRNSHFSESINGISASPFHSKCFFFLSFSLYECWSMFFTLAHHFTIAFWWEDCDKLLLWAFLPVIVYKSSRKISVHHQNGDDDSVNKWMKMVIPVEQEKKQKSQFTTIFEYGIEQKSIKSSLGCVMTLWMKLVYRCEAAKNHTYAHK